MRTLLFAFILLLPLSIGAQDLPEQQRYKLAAAYSAENRGVSVLVMKGDKIVFEDYPMGLGPDMPWFLASGTKSFSGVMLAAAIEDKLISGFDEKVSDTIAEWKAEKQKSQITLRQLLSLTSGIDAGQIGLVPSYTDAPGFAMKSDPGTKFEYGPVPFQVFGEVMSRKLASKKETVMGYLKRRILDPIGLKAALWRTKDGKPLLPQGAVLTAREWAKFGLFLKDGGKFGGKQIVAKALLDELIVGSKANPSYGITFWLNSAGLDPQGRATTARVGELKDSLAKDVYMAAGAGNQRLYIIPSLDVVVVRQGNFGSFDDREFLGRLILGETPPARKPAGR